MTDLIPGEEEFEIEDSCFECIVCEEMVEFEFEAEETVDDEMPEEMDDKMMEAEMDPDFELKPEGQTVPEAVESEMKIECICGARYIVRKVPGIPGYEVRHITEEEEFQDDITEEGDIF